MMRRVAGMAGVPDLSGFGAANGDESPAAPAPGPSRKKLKKKRKKKRH
jgi:hypothetical protein